MASESGGSEAARDAGHQNHFRQLAQEGKSWSGREPNVLFQNRGDHTYDEVGNVTGLASRLDSRGAATGDLDGDGDLDLVVYNRNNPTIRIYRNDTPERLQGSVALVDLEATAGNREGLGAQVSLRCDGRRMMRQVDAGSGYLSQNAHSLHFGLGDCQGIDEIEVRWPGGAVEAWTDLPVNQRLTLVQGASAGAAGESVATTALAARNFNAGEVAAAAGGLSSPAPELVLQDIEGQASIDLQAPGLKVLNFWATWCTTCAAEMKDLQALDEEYAARGVDFVGVVMEEPATLDAVRDYVTKRSIDYLQVWGDLEIQEPFASLGNTQAGAVPVTAVLDDGLVRYVHVGTIVKDDLAEVLDGLLVE